MEVLYQWCVNLPKVFSEFIEFMTTKMPYIGISPLSFFTVGGITALIGFLALRLVVGG